MRIFKGKIIRNIKNQKERKKKRQQERFAIIYDRTITEVFLDKEKINLDKFVAIPRDIFSRGLSKAALAVYPVLCSRADFEEDKEFQISQKNIGYLTGADEGTVRKAIDELTKAKLATERMVTSGTRHFYIYTITFTRKPNLEIKDNRAKSFPFYNCIIDNGIWAELKPRAKVLYLTMRASAKPADLDLYCSIEYDEYYEPIEYDVYIQNRKWDLCDLSLSELCRLAGIERSNIEVNLTDLERFKLIERIGYIPEVGKYITKVYLRPRRFMEHDGNE